MFAFGFLAAGLVLARRFKELGKPVDWAYEMVGAALIGGLVGSRVYYLFQHTSQFSHDPLGSIFSGTGLVWYGGAIGGGVGGGLWGRRRGVLYPQPVGGAHRPPAAGGPARGVGRPGLGGGRHGEA